jgi:hypothetical protein
MPAIGDIKLSDKATNGILVTTDAAVGVNRTFSPAGSPAFGVTRWEDRSGGIPIGYPIITVSLRRPQKGNRNYKMTMKLSVPTLEQTSPSTASGIQPAPTLAYACSAIVDFIIPERSSDAERLVLMRLFRSWFMDTINASDGTPSDASGSPYDGLIRLCADMY